MGKATTRNPHADPRVLSGGGRCWVDCLCGWVSPMFRTAQAASLAWSEHVAATQEPNEEAP